MNKSTMSSTHKDLGRAPSTVKGDSVSVRFYNAYRAVRGRTLDFDNMVYAEIENENLESEIQELADYCSSNVIPARFRVLSYHHNQKLVMSRIKTNKYRF